jgi:pyoverdine/dityrosine biosynthesis protein Dit1
MTFMNCVLNTSLIDEVTLSSVHKTDVRLAQAIMLIVSQYRRMTGPKTLCSSSVCEPCFAPHLDKLITAIQSQVAIEFVLPAFPAKSPNLNKVLGTLPDRAEKLSLEFLQSICQQIQTIYAPGARVILCSDGRVFNDVIGILDDDVTHYQQALSQMIKQMNY